MIGIPLPNGTDVSRFDEMVPDGTVFMIFNNNYRSYCRDEYNKYSLEAKKNRSGNHDLSIGVFALVLAIVIKIGLYRILLKHYGAHATHAILDYAMYSIVTHQNNSNTMEDTMCNHVLFSVFPYSDSWYSDFREKTMNKDDNQNFLDDWLVLNTTNPKFSSVAVSVDGTNFNNEAEDNKLTSMPVKFATM